MYIYIRVSNQSISPQASPESGPSVVLVSVVQQGADQVPPSKMMVPEIFLVQVSTTEMVSIIDVWIQNVFVRSPEVLGQLVEALSLASLWWSG